MIIIMQSKTSFFTTICKELATILAFKIQCTMITCGPSLSFMQQCKKSLFLKPESVNVIISMSNLVCFQNLRIVVKRACECTRNANTVTLIIIMN